MPDGLELPKFPTLFTEEDKERIRQLEEQRKALAQAYQVKFSEQAWERVPGIEKAIRKVTPPWLAPVVRALPGTAETMEFGFTPEQFRTRQLDIEEEYKELARREKVTRLLPNVQADILVAALSGEPITTKSELLSTFPELREDFNEEEIGYLSRLSEAVLHAPPEKFLSGELFATEPSQLPLSEEDLGYFKEGVHDPREVFATVSFVRSVEGVTAALKAAFPAKGEEEDTAEAVRASLQEYFRQRGEELGITPEGAKQAITRLHTQVADKEGKAVALVDDGGRIFSARQRKDNTLYVEDKIVGYRLPNGMVTGFNLQGQPITTPEEEESAAKDLWDAWYLASNQAGISTEKALTTILPDFFLKIAEKAAPYTVIGDKEAKEASVQEIQRWRIKLNSRYEQSNLEFQKWLGEHPELATRPEWAGPIKGVGDFLNPGRIAYTIASNAPIIAMGLATGIGVSVFTGNPMTGAMAASAVLTPTMISGVVDDCVAEGASFEDATTIGSVVGLAMGVVEIFPWAISLRILHPAFMSAFRGNLKKELAKTVTKNLIAKGIAGQVVKNTLTILAVEEAEEFIQQIMQNATVKTFNENRSLLEGVGQTALQTFWAVMPLALAGGATTFYSMKANLPLPVQQKIDEVATKLEEAGLEPDHAQAVGLAQVLETETGQAQVEEAVEKAEEQVPVTSAKLTKAESKLTSLSEEITHFQSNLKTQEDRLAKLAPYERAEQQSSIDNLEKQIEELRADREATLTKISRIKKELEKPSKVAPVTPIAFSEEIPSGVQVQIQTLMDSLPSNVGGIVKGFSVNPAQRDLALFDPSSGNIVLKNDRVITDQLLYHEVAHAVMVKEIDTGNFVLVDEFLRHEQGLTQRMIAETREAHPELARLTDGELLYEVPTGWKRAEESFANRFADYVTGKPLSGVFAELYPRWFPRIEVTIPEAEVGMPKGVKPGEVTEQPMGEEELKFRRELPDYLEMFHRKINIPNEPEASAWNKQMYDAYKAMGHYLDTWDDATKSKYVADRYDYVTHDAMFPEASEMLGLEDRTHIQGILWHILREQQVMRALPKAKAGMPPAWDTMSFADKRAKAIKAGIAQTAANLSWSELTDVQQERLEAVVPEVEQAAEIAAEEDVLQGGEKAEEYTIERMAQLAKEAEEHLRQMIPDLTYRPSQGMPRLPDFDMELKRLRDRLDANPALKALVHSNKALKDLMELGRAVLEKNQANLKEAEESGNKELAKEIAERLKKASRGTKLGSKALLTKSWGDLTPPEQTRVALAFVPDHSISTGIIDEFRDTVLVLAAMEEKTGLPFLYHYERIEEARGYCYRLQDEYHKRIDNVPRWRRIIRNREKMEQVALIIDSRREGSTTVVKQPVTEEEHLMVEIADAMTAVFREWEPIVRFQRFMEAYEDNPTLKSIQEQIPDAPEDDLQFAIDVLEQKGEDELWDYLGFKSWGVIGSGYSPWKIAHPNLSEDRPKWSSVRGAGYLMSRDTTRMPWETQKHLFAIYDSYNLSMALRFFLRREVKALADSFYGSYDKWTNPDHAQNYLREYLRAVQRFPDEDASFFLRLMRKVQSWSHPNIFWHPFVGARNIIQFVWSHPHRTELIRAIWEVRKLSPTLRTQAMEKFATSVDQSGRVLRHWMFQDEEVSILGEIPSWLKTVLTPFRVASKGLDFLAAQTAKIPTIAVTDKASRMPSYTASLNKASRATEQYKLDLNAKKWFNKSGINSGYIHRQQQVHILELLALGDETVSWAVPGLLEVSGYNAACIRIAEETTNRTLYLYDKAIAAGVHRGGGRTLSSLFTFPRSTIQMYGMQFARLLSKDSTAGERIAASRHIFNLWLVGEILGYAFMALTGRRRKEYSVVNTLTWSFGGLGIGVTYDAIELFNDLLFAAAGDDEDKGRAWDRLIQTAPRVLDVLVGFYKIAMDTTEAITDEMAGLDKRYLRKIRAFLDEHYTPEEQEKAERTIHEIVLKIVAGSEAPEPDAFEKSLKIAGDNEERLGELDLGGKYYTRKELGSSLEAIIKDLPDYILIQEAGWSDFTLFYFDCREGWLELFTLPSDNRAAKLQGLPTREEWRKEHVLEEAMLLFWGKYQKSVFAKGSPQAKEITSLIKLWEDKYRLDRYTRPEASWLLPPKVNLPEAVATLKAARATHTSWRKEVRNFFGKGNPEEWDREWEENYNRLIDILERFVKKSEVEETELHWAVTKLREDSILHREAAKQGLIKEPDPWIAEFETLADALERMSTGA